MCASPQKENGYIPIANEIAERFCETKHRISGDEWTILWIILRKTYGWNKPEDAIPLSQFTEISGMKRQNVHRALKKLSSKKMIAIIKNDDRQPLSISFQKDYEKWVLSSKKIIVIKNDDRPVIKIDSNLSSKLIPSKDNTKDNIKTNTLSSKLDLAAPILYLNEKTGKKFNPKNKTSLRLINGRMAEGRTIDDFKIIIDRKVKKWGHDPKMADYLRPSTLFNATNFENYLNEKDDIMDDMDKIREKFGLKKR